MSQPKYLYSVSRFLGGTRAAKPSALGRIVALPDMWLYLRYLPIRIQSCRRRHLIIS